MAQTEPEDTSLVEKNGRLFHRYVVKPGNTLYSISKLYHVSVQEIQEFNPESTNGLSIGDTLYIISAKNDKQSIEKKLESDGNFIVHEVQKKQTLYAISKIYGISVSDIMAANPELKNGLNEGQFIKIPIVKLKEAEKEVISAKGENYISHEVKSKETLYSLSKLYGVPIDSIKHANNGLPAGLVEGQMLAIPKKDGRMEEADSTAKKDIYNVAVILPLFLDMNDSLMAKMKIDEKEKVFSKSIIAIQFYQGCLMAVDSLEKQGMRFNVRYYDSANDSNAVDKMISEGKFNNSDLIIGPFYLSQFRRVVEFARERKIHIVCPVPQNNRILLGNPYVSKVATSRNVIYKNLGRYIAYLYKTQNIIIVGQQFRADPFSLAFKTEFLATLQKSGDTSNINNLKEVKWDKGSIEPIKALLRDSVYNVLLVPSTDQVYVTELIANLNNLHKTYMIKVIGVDQWLKYSNIDFEYFNNLGVMIPVDGYTGFDRPEVKTFVQNYHLKYKQFPEKFAFQGFDIAYFYLQQLNKLGTRFESGLVDAKDRHLYFKFKYFKTGIESGYENSSTVLLKYENFELIEVPVFD